MPETAEEVADVVRTCADHLVPVTARGTGSGLSGVCIPAAGGVVVSFQRMNRILEIDSESHVAVVQPGVQLDQLDAALAEVGLAYPVYPGEYSATIGGNIGTNAGGMQAVKHGVTRHHVLGLEMVLATERSSAPGAESSRPRRATTSPSWSSVRRGHSRW